jgi:hypothetical protein
LLYDQASLNCNLPIWGLLPLLEWQEQTSMLFFHWDVVSLFHPQLTSNRDLTSLNEVAMIISESHQVMAQEIFTNLFGSLSWILRYWYQLINSVCFSRDTKFSSYFHFFFFLVIFPFNYSLNFKRYFCGVIATRRTVHRT